MPRVLMLLTTAMLVACSDGSTDDSTDTPPVTFPAKDLTGDAAAGATVYASNCSLCHGANGEGGTGIQLDDGHLADMDIDTLFMWLYDGSAGMESDGIMPAYRDQLSDQELADVAEFILTEW